MLRRTSNRALWLPAEGKRRSGCFWSWRTCAASALTDWGSDFPLGCLEQNPLKQGKKKKKRPEFRMNLALNKLHKHTHTRWVTYNSENKQILVCGRIFSRMDYMIIHTLRKHLTGLSPQPEVGLHRVVLSFLFISFSLEFKKDNKDSVGAFDTRQRPRWSEFPVVQRD